jgi:hypothetical protein
VVEKDVDAALKEVVNTKMVMMRTLLLVVEEEENARSPAEIPAKSPAKDAKRVANVPRKDVENADVN